MSITHKNNKKKAQGFTLIELMVTVAIVGILAAVAIPAYQDYVARSQLSEGIELASGAKPLVGEYYANHGTFPASLSDTGYTGAVGKYISSTTIDSNGNIIATFGNNANNKIAGQTVSLSPKLESAGNVSWDCTSSANAKYLPNSCSHVDASTGNSGSGDNGSTPPKTPEELAYQGNGTYALSGHTMTYTNGVLTSSGHGGALQSIDPDGTMHFLIAGINVAMNPNGDVTEVRGTSNVSTVSYNMNASNGLNFMNTNTTVTDPTTGQSLVIHNPTINLNATDYSSIQGALSNLQTAAASAGLTPSADNISAYNTALSQFKTALTQVKTDNGGTYPSDWNSGFIADWATY